MVLLAIQSSALLPSVLVNLLVGIFLVLSFQEEKQFLLRPSAGVASMHMGNKPFEIPDYSSLPMLQVPTVKEILPTDSFQVGSLMELSKFNDMHHCCIGIFCESKKY